MNTAEPMAPVHALELVELAEGAYGKENGHIMRVAVWATMSGRASMEDLQRWVTIYVDDDQPGRDRVLRELVRLGHARAFAAARDD